MTFTRQWFLFIDLLLQFLLLELYTSYLNPHVFPNQMN